MGNGFDLAHNLKTSYSHFIITYLKNAIIESYVQNIFNDSPIIIRNAIKFSRGMEDLDKFLENLNTISEIFNNQHIKHNLPAISNHPNIGSKTGMFKFEINSEFLKRLFSKGYLNNWVDIETEYYNFLLEIIEDPREKNKNMQIQKLNSDFDFLSKRLQSYLSEIERFTESLNLKENSEFTQKMVKLIFPKQTFKSGRTNDRYSCLILNFNYTSTIDYYIDKNPHDYNVEKINIHGSTNPSDDFIFGYGHVPGEKYKSIEDFGFDEAQKNLKVFNYFNNNSFTRFTSFLDKDDFEVIVLGHSCGESDGSTLIRLFNHKKCNRIHICHYRKEEFQPKLVQIKRHCPDPDERIFNIIRPFNEELSIPQLV